jgi:hypothetical protein
MKKNGGKKSRGTIPLNLVFSLVSNASKMALFLHVTEDVKKKA